MIVCRDWPSTLLFVMMSALLAWSFPVVADTRTTSDYIAIVVEAEDHTRRDDRWILTEPTTPAQEDDPDANHSDQAVGQAYLELLPDIRVTHDDEFGPPTALWDTPGTGPQAHYPLDFPEAGRYYVHLRAYSTGTEDNGIHIGLNDEWPNSGARMQFCTAGQGWAWSSNQRDAGGGACGVQKTIWVTVEEPGTHTFMISAREDGFEVDRMMLIKDLSDNTRICSPSGADDITCVNGSVENTDDVVDMSVAIETDVTSAEMTDNVELTVAVRNEDGFDTASGVEMTVELGLGERWESVTIDDRCSTQNGNVVCTMGNIVPTGHENRITFSFTLRALQSGEVPITASISTTSIDDETENDTATTNITVGGSAELSQLTAVWQDTGLNWVEGTSTTLPLTISSVGNADAADVTAEITFATGLTIGDLPQECQQGEPVSCTIESITTGEQQTLSFTVTPDATGIYSAVVSATASNHDGEASTNTSVIVANAATDTTDGNETPGDTTGGDTTTGDTAVKKVSTASGSVGLITLLMLLFGSFGIFRVRRAA